MDSKFLPDPIPNPNSNIDSKLVPDPIPNPNIDHKLGPDPIPNMDSKLGPDPIPNPNIIRDRIRSKLTITIN